MTMQELSVILKEAGVTNEDIIVSTGTSFADSLSASAAGKPILLVNNKSSKLSDVQNEYLATLSTSNFYIVGGENAVSKLLESEIKAYGETKRLGGATRYETSVLVAKEFFTSPTTAVVAYGQNFPDGLCGGPLAAKLNAPLILTENGNEAVAVEYASENNICKGYALGGPIIISNNVIRNIFRMDAGTSIVNK